ncbi:MAG: peptidylprolyl isomerase [Bacteroidota bacterium]
MRKHLWIRIVGFLLLFTGCKNEHSELKDGIYAEIETDKGTLIAVLDYQRAPVTVANFITLSEGTNPFVREALKDKKAYDNTRWHRVISKNNGDAEDFMIQGGDPDGTGSGDAGYQFKDEFSDLKFDEGGLLAMANSGAATNSCQFFITLVPTPWLDNKHTLFGKVIGDGMLVVNAIKQFDKILSVRIIRKGEAAKKFDAVKIFSDYFKIESERQKKQERIDAANLKVYEAEKQAFFKNLKAKAIQTKSGLSYCIITSSNREKPKLGAPISVHYSGYFENGKLFDTSDRETARKFGQFNAQKDAMQAYAPLPLKAGDRSGAIPGFAEGVGLLKYGEKAVVFIPSKLAYGESGAGEVIPPNTDLIFELHITKP